MWTVVGAVVLVVALSGRWRGLVRAGCWGLGIGLVGLLLLGGLPIPGKLVPYYAHLPAEHKPALQLVSRFDWGLRLLGPGPDTLWLVASNSPRLAPVQAELRRVAGERGLRVVDATGLFTNKALHQANRLPVELWAELVQKVFHTGLISPARRLAQRVGWGSGERFGELECSPAAFMGQADLLAQLMCTHQASWSDGRMERGWRPIPLVLLLDGAMGRVEQKLYRLLRTPEGAHFFSWACGPPLHQLAAAVLTLGPAGSTIPLEIDLADRLSELGASQLLAPSNSADGWADRLGPALAELRPQTRRQLLVHNRFLGGGWGEFVHINNGPLQLVLLPWSPSTYWQLWQTWRTGLQVTRLNSRHTSNPNVASDSELRQPAHPISLAQFGAWADHEQLAANISARGPLAGLLETLWEREWHRGPAGAGLNPSLSPLAAGSGRPWTDRPVISWRQPGSGGLGLVGADGPWRVAGLGRALELAGAGLPEGGWERAELEWQERHIPRIRQALVRDGAARLPTELLALPASTLLLLRVEAVRLLSRGRCGWLKTAPVVSAVCGSLAGLVQTAVREQLVAHSSIMLSYSAGCTLGAHYDGSLYTYGATISLGPIEQADRSWPLWINSHSHSWPDPLATSLERAGDLAVFNASWLHWRTAWPKGHSMLAFQCAFRSVGRL